MNSIFSYESKFMQMLIQLADMVILNLLYLLCCAPLFTIGAAQAALHSGIRKLMDKENEGSCVRAFFRGFTGGFGKITLLHTLLALMIAVLVWIAGIAFAMSGYGLPTIICLLAVFLAMLFYSMVSFFHAYFDCTPWRLLKNSCLMVLAHPLRSLAVAALMWLPFIVLFLNLYIFLQGFPLWAFLYYSVAFLFCYSLMKKPFTELKEDFLAAQAEAE